MEALAREGKIDYVEFTNEDGKWWGDIIWMFDDGNVGVLATNQNEPNGPDMPFVLKCNELSAVDGVVWCDVMVQLIKEDYTKHTYTEDDQDKPMHTTVQIFLKRHDQAIWFLLIAVLFYALWRQFKK